MSDAARQSSAGSQQQIIPQPVTLLNPSPIQHEETLSSVDGDEGIGSFVGSPSPEQSAEDAEKEVKIRSVLKGQLDDLPPLSSKIVRVFTSSTFTGKYTIIFIIHIIYQLYSYQYACNYA